MNKLTLKICFTQLILLFFAGYAFAVSGFTFIDTNGDLFADPPASPEQFVDLDVLLFS